MRPLSWLYGLLSNQKRLSDLKKQSNIPVPVIVIGNIAIGGTGKTPIIIAISQYLREQGLNVGIISRGYGSHAPRYPYKVSPTENPSVGGDEPTLIAQKTRCPVVIAPDRNAAVQLLLAEHKVDLILSDDGLQHWKLARDWEICVVDGQRGVGNGLLLPAGPLRELPERLDSVNAILINGSDTRLVQTLTDSPVSIFTIEPSLWCRVDRSQEPSSELPEVLKDSNIKESTATAISGIGNPQRFFDTLDQLSIVHSQVTFPDHHPFSQEDLINYRDQVVIMTAKDAVKCREFAGKDWWYLDIEAKLPVSFLENLQEFLVKHELKSAD